MDREFGVPTSGVAPRGSVPALVVVGADGRDVQFLQVCGGRDEGERALLRCVRACVRACTGNVAS